MKHIRKLANRKNNKSVERVVTQSSQPTKKVIDTKMIIVQQPKEQKKKATFDKHYHKDFWKTQWF